MHTRTAERIEITGVVQGVGFRPFVHRLASELGLVGSVGNDSTRVFIDVAGRADLIDEFVARLVEGAPPLARVEAVTRAAIDTAHETAFTQSGFHIVDSRSAVGRPTLVPPDTAVCDDCLSEMSDPGDRRYRHPFITCTNCGPRFTIICSLPYDRPNTTMDTFDLCLDCRSEYDDPRDRRHHAQPVACHSCGPTLTLVQHRTDAPSVVGDSAIHHTRAMLDAGSIVAIKSLGGFHLACDARHDEAVTALRARKHRPDKPFAVMVGDLDQVRRLAAVTDAEAAQLTSAARPIVLLRARSNAPVSALVAPENPLIGVMLPYTPVHHLLFADNVGALVMTSGNLGGQPIIHRDQDARQRLGPLCDAMLTHDRPIQVPCDDSVVRLVDDGLLPLRRARGFTPIPVTLKDARRDVLAVGGELKNTFCVTSGEKAWVGQHVGDMANLETLNAFEASIDQFHAMYATEPAVVAIDAHPAYVTGRWARAAYPDRIMTVQHHHAHIAAVMAEHGLDPNEPILGFVFDGTGYGTDGTIWGGEVLVATATGFERVAHLAPVLLPGGDTAIEHPCRVALVHLAAAGVAWAPDLAPAAQLSGVQEGVLRRQLDSGYGCVPTTSMGRLFDAVASLLGLRHHITYEAQAAIDLEGAAVAGPGVDRGYRFAEVDGLLQPAPVIEAVVADLRAGVAAPDIAFAFHVAVVEAVFRSAERLRGERDLHTVALSGGVFQNALMSRLCCDRLGRAGFDVRTHQLVPANDGGLALGQAFVAAHSSTLDGQES